MLIDHPLLQERKKNAQVEEEEHAQRRKEVADRVREYADLLETGQVKGMYALVIMEEGEVIRTATSFSDRLYCMGALMAFIRETWD